MNRLGGQDCVLGRCLESGAQAQSRSILPSLGMHMIYCSRHGAVDVVIQTAVKRGYQELQCLDKHCVAAPYVCLALLETRFSMIGPPMTTGPRWARGAP